MHEIQVSLRATGGTNLSAAFRTVEKAMKAEDLERLRALGYVQ